MLEIAAEIGAIVMEGAHDDEAAAMPGAGIFPHLDAAFDEPALCRRIGALAVGVIEAPADAGSENGAKGGAEDGRRHAAIAVADGRADEATGDAADHRAALFLGPAVGSTPGKHKSCDCHHRDRFRFHGSPRPESTM